MLPFETLDKAELNSVRLDLVHQLQCFKCSTEEKGILRDILVDILNLQHGLEDNLLVIQQIQQVDPGTREDYKELALNTARQHIIDINSVYQQGLDWLKNDQVCDTLELDDEDDSLVPDMNLDQLSSDCFKSKNVEEMTPQSSSDGDETLPIDKETNVSKKHEIEEGSLMNSKSEDEIRVRAPNWSDRQSTCLKDLIKNLDGGDIYTAILDPKKTMKGKERKKRAWDRVYREFRKIPGNKVFKLKHILCKYKNIKNELIEERRFQADGLPYYSSNGEDWMRTNQAGDTLGFNEEDFKEDLEVVPDLDLDQISSDSSGFNKNIETNSEFDKLPRDQEGNAAIMFFNEERNKRRLVKSVRGGGKRRRAPNWSEQQTACLMDLIKTLDGGKIYTILLNNNKTKVGIERKERAWDRVYREFTKIPGNKVFKLKHLFFKYKNIRKLNKELLEEKRSHAVQTDGLPHYSSNGEHWGFTFDDIPSYIFYL
ncbi:uncharacterized protein LOC111707486 [Eurytemora carolleeae]|uniref:uncharacterized protein LOC111707486 n=1 Tax=Eurytemora carolleeae TaxID=1294199 RepID=UPI000C76EB1A|nr:uncharacterized protein LOC111707486 [Eurytemora carolleeae]|eukprot:XP_023336363.1 uncharacterized protein LOC111707486 [Eurytemora affinis]